MKGIIIYYSGTGNTKYLVNKLMAEFDNKQNDLLAISIEEFNLNVIDYDVLIFAFPNYFGHAPSFFIDFIKNNLPETNREKVVFLIATESLENTISFKEVESELTSKGYRIKLAKSYTMPSNIQGVDIQIAENLFEMFKNEDKRLSVNYNACIKCRFCIRGCYFNNIKLVDNKIEHLENCKLCMRCLNLCPKNAICFEDINLTQYKDNIGLVII
jgi:ferredoxin